MARILTGVQASGKVHLGNILGAIRPAIALSNKAGNDSYLFIADLHSLTTVRNTKELQDNIKGVAMAWLACGLDVEKVCFYRQSRVADIHTELFWYLSCLTPHPMAMNGVSIKDKVESGLAHEANAGLYSYPMLQAADILLYKANLVPVGKDQKQNIEITRDLARSFNKLYGDALTVPDAIIDDKVKTIPGTDGRKMSKSLKNYIDIFAEEKILKKQVNSIITENTSIDEPKEYWNCNVYALYELVASDEEQLALQARYLNGGMGFGYVKTLLFEKLLTKFSEERKRYAYYKNNEQALEAQLLTGEKKARAVASETLQKVRELYWGI